MFILSWRKGKEINRRALVKRGARERDEQEPGEAEAEAE